MTVYFVFLNQEVNKTGLYRLYCDSARTIVDSYRYNKVHQARCPKGLAGFFMPSMFNKVH